MAQGLLQNLDATLEVHSAGTKPAAEVHPLAVKVMFEEGIDISNHKPKHIEQYLAEAWDYVITVCDGAHETCPVFTGKVHKQLHIPYEDPDAFSGPEAEILENFRRVRDQIKEGMQHFYKRYR